MKVVSIQSWKNDGFRDSLAKENDNWIPNLSEAEMQRMREAHYKVFPNVTKENNDEAFLGD